MLNVKNLMHVLKTQFFFKATKWRVKICYIIIIIYPIQVVDPSILNSIDINELKLYPNCHMETFSSYRLL